MKLNPRKLNQLFGAARREPAPVPAEGFDRLVMQRVRRESGAGLSPATTFSLFDQLNALFPRLALAAAVMIAVCVAGEVVSSVTNPSLADSVSQISDQWLFASNGF